MSLKNKNSKQQVDTLRGTQGRPVTAPLGVVPAYLEKRRKVEEFDKVLTLQQIENNKKPSDCIVLDETERKDTLQGLKRKHKELSEQLDAVPISLFTKRAKDLRAKLIAELEEVERSITVFSRSKVIVRNE